MLEKTVAIIQSNYIPWVGYFAIAAACDTFIVFEDVQYTKNDWRNRNRIEPKRSGSHVWLTVPVYHADSKQKFVDTKVVNDHWPKKHFETLKQAFSREPGWHLLGGDIERLYANAKYCQYLWQVNRIFLEWIFGVLRIKSTIIFLTHSPESEDPTARLISILKSNGATRYLSGPSAANYIAEDQFTKAGINLEYVNYEKIIRQTFKIQGDIKKTSVIQLLLEGCDRVKSN